MSRRSRRLDLTLLLAVAPLVGACDDAPEERHCVGPNGIYVDPRQCEPTAVGYVGGTHWIYVPHGYYPGIGGNAGVFSSSTTRGGSSSFVRGGSPGFSGGGSRSISRGGFGSIGAGHASGE